MTISIPLLRIVVEPAFWMILMIVPAAYLCYWVWFGITCKMAKKRHRAPLGWVLLSFCISPIWVWILLLIVGDKKE